MLETIREYAVERLEESGEAELIGRRHAEYMTGLAESVEFDYLGPEQAAVRERFRIEWDNVRAALGWALESEEAELGLRLVGALAMLWLDRNLAVEVVQGRGGPRRERDLVQGAVARAGEDAEEIRDVRGDEVDRARPGP